MDKELIDFLEQKFAGVDEKFAGVDKKFAGIDEKFAVIDRNFALVGKEFGRMEKRFEDLSGEVKGFKLDIESYVRQSLIWHTDELKKELKAISLRDKQDSDALASEIVGLDKRVTALERKATASPA